MFKKRAALSLLACLVAFWGLNAFADQEQDCLDANGVFYRVSGQIVCKCKDVSFRPEAYYCTENGLVERNLGLGTEQEAPIPGIQPVTEDHPKYGQLSPKFIELGKMHSFHVPAYQIPAQPAGWLWGQAVPAQYIPAKNLILSGVAKEGEADLRMSQPQAVAYCRDIVGGGARLPTKDEYIALSRAMGAIQPVRGATEFSVRDYNRNLIPDMNGRFFWSATVNPGCSGLAFGFVSPCGSVTDTLRNYEAFVRCVR